MNKDYGVFADGLAAAKIGSWRIELDEGAEPRMYADATMKQLLGLAADADLSPEEVYHAWYDHVDEAHYEAVAEGVGHMLEGKLAEIQYPWHHPDGRTIVVRCGGIRDENYTAGARAAGIHQWVTSMYHVDRELEAQQRQLQETMETLEVANRHEKLRADALDFIQKNDDLEAFVNFLSWRVLELYGCDQVVYRDVKGLEIVKERPNIEPFDLTICPECPHYTFDAPTYANGFAVIEGDRCNGQPVHPGCRVRAALTYLVYEDKEVYGYIALHYLDRTHSFSDREKDTFDRIAKFMSMVLSRRKQQEAVRRSLALEKANKAKSYFFSMVSHDIRTPLNAIIGYAELLKLGMANEAERAKAIDSVLVSGHTLLELINDVLDLSKLEAGKMEILPEPVDPKRLVEEVADAFRATIGGKPVEIRTVVPVLPWLKLDPHRVRQILFNFVGNAVKFTDTGYVEIRAEYERTGSGRGTFRFAVADTGCGISEDDQRRVALPYVQVGLESSRGKGTGLGLAICKQLVARMEGEFGLESELGKGSTFSVAIPNVEEEDDARRARLSATQRIRVAVGGKTPVCGRVLIVDDVPMNRMVLRSMLKKLGVITIEMAENGFGALQKIVEAGPFDLVLTDMWMPGMDGERLVREIRKNPIWAELPVYAVTADVEAQKSYLGMGFSGVLLKPLTFEKLEEFFRTNVRI